MMATFLKSLKPTAFAVAAFTAFLSSSCSQTASVNRGLASKSAPTDLKTAARKIAGQNHTSPGDVFKEVSADDIKAATPKILDLASCNPSSPLPPRRIWRLTPEQVKNVLDDVFAGQSMPRPEFVDDKALGYRNNSAILTFQAPHASSMLTWVEATSTALVDGGAAVLGCSGDGTSKLCLQTFLKGKGRLLARGNISAEFEKKIIAVYEGLAETVAPRNAMRGALELLLASPQFLYRSEWGDGPVSAGRVRLTPLESASSISFTVWNSAPDAELLAKTSGGNLSTEADVKREVERLAASPKSVRASTQFLRKWLGYDDFASKRGTITDFPSSPANPAPIVSGEADEVVARAVTQNAHLGGFLSGPASLGGSLSSGLRAQGIDDLNVDAGMLSHPAVVASHSENYGAAVVHRGLFLMEALFCKTTGGIPPAAANAVFDMQTPGEVVSTRKSWERIQLMPACAGCHLQINPLGFSMLNYTRVGALQSLEKGMPIDTSGTFPATVSGQPIAFNNFSSMVAAALDEGSVQQCFTRHYARFSMGFELPHDSCEISRSFESFRTGGFKLSDLPVRLATPALMMFRQAAP